MQLSIRTAPHELRIRGHRSQPPRFPLLRACKQGDGLSHRQSFPKIALGYTLDEIKNDVTGKTYACFEPALDYVVVKLPKWPFDKFLYAKRGLGSRMKATGAIMKAVRGAEISLDTLNAPKFSHMGREELLSELHKTTDERLFAVYAALHAGVSPDEIFEITKIDRWFLYKLLNLVEYERHITGKKLSKEEYLTGKRLGFGDRALSERSGNKLPPRRRAAFKMVDTCAAEFSAQTPYFYSTYDDLSHDEAKPFVEKSISEKKKRVIVIGSGPIRIGQGIEFDYSSVHCVWTLKSLGFEVVIINNNPETVSTDFDTADRLYFESLTPEDVQNVIDVEKPYGVVVTFGGQTAIKLCGYLARKGVRILGTSADSVDMAEDRERFDRLLERFDIARPKGLTVMTKEEAIDAAETLGYPVLLRPSYVIGGQNMTIAFTENDISRYMDVILAQKIENPVLCDKYLMGTELEVDAISDGTDVLIPGIMQHVERAGVHSGDSIAVYPPYHLSDAMLSRIVEVSTQLALELKTKGLINIQYLIYQDRLYVIEVNPRASRTIPYISKVTGVPMVELATRIMTGSKLKKLGYGTGLYPNSPYVAVKVPVFSFEKLNDVNSQLGPEMKSTGEVLGIGKTIEEALFKGLVSAGFKMCHPSKEKPVGVYFTINDQDKPEIVSIAKKFADLGCRLYATAGTAKVIEALGIEVTVVERLKATKQVSGLMDEGKIDYIIYTGKTDVDSIADYIELHHHAVLLGVTVLTSLDTANALCDIIASKFTEYNTELVDINHLRKKKLSLGFVKMQSCGNDFIVFDNTDGAITCPESLAVNFVDRHYGIGGDGIVLLERSEIADAKMRIFNRDGSEGLNAANAIRCIAKYLCDHRMTEGDTMTVETVSGVRRVTVYSFGGVVSSASVELLPEERRAKKNSLFVRALEESGTESAFVRLEGGDHFVLFDEKVDSRDLGADALLLEGDAAYAQKPDFEAVRVVNRVTVKLRAFEQGNGEVYASGTGAAAAVYACVKRGLCDTDADVTVKVRGGDLIVHCFENGALTLTGGVQKIYEGRVEF